MDSGLYAELADLGHLISHREVGLDSAATVDAVAVLEPEPIDLLSFPYEWSFSALKDAALLTLDLATAALERGMVLKDATAYNVQFRQDRPGPVFIDTLSFERYQEGEPWVAYAQFCRHFLAPLALMALVDIRLGSLLATYRDGIPLDLASRLLPRGSWFKPGLMAHLHLHAKAQSQDGNAATTAKAAKVSKLASIALIDSLRSAVKRLEWKPKGTTWAAYYSETNYSDGAMRAKHEMVGRALEGLRADFGPQASCWDLGANDGEFSRLAKEAGYRTAAFDSDPAAVEKAYRRYRESSGALPFLVDLTNPSPAGGWANQEQASLLERGPADVVLALALVHHLAIGRNVPLPMFGDLLAQLGEVAIVEFVPKADSQVQRLLRSREDIFDKYDEAGFEEAISDRFEVLSRDVVEGTCRTLYVLRRR
jgi:ribosomal protein L11 methylase PrmA